MPESDFLWETPAVPDVDNPGSTATNRMRLGHPRLQAIGTTGADLAAARLAVASLTATNMPAYDNQGTPIAPTASDPLRDVKRALAFRPSTGAALISGARFSGYLKSNFEVRSADGAVLFQTVDHDFVPDPANAPTTKKPGLSYLRLGKPEPRLRDAEGKELPRAQDQLMDQKYKPGIGLFSDGELYAWTRKPLNFRSGEAFYITAPAYSLSSYGESKIVTYEINDPDDIARVNNGELNDVDVARKIINFNWLRPTSRGWYRQIFDRGQAFSFTTANKGDFSQATQYSLGIGAKFDHSLAVGLSTEFSGKIAISKGFSIDIGTGGAIFKHPFGAWTKEGSAELTGDSSVKLTITGIDTAAMETAMKVYSGLLHAAVAAQTAYFAAYNGKLAARAGQTLAGGEDDNAHGFKDTLEDGVSMYEDAIKLSAVICAAGCVMAALQAAWSNLRLVPIPLTPTVEVSRTGINLFCGPSYIQLSHTGIRIGSSGTVMIGGSSLHQMSPSINHLPLPPPPPLPV